MSSEVPVLQAIHKYANTADWYPTHIASGDAVVACIGIDSNNAGYKVTTYAREWGFDGFQISTQAEGGIFGDSGPVRVELGRDFGKILLYSVEEVKTENDGSLIATVNVTQPARQERLLLPGDVGFEHFEALHQQVRDLQPVITEAVDLIQPSIKPEVLVYKHKSGLSPHFNHEQQTATVSGSTLLEVRYLSGNRVRVDLDATQDYPFDSAGGYPKFTSSEKTVYRFGTALVEQRGSKQLLPLNESVLTAFRAVQNAVEKLYKPNPRL